MRQKTTEGPVKVRVQLPSSLEEEDTLSDIHWSWVGPESPAVSLAFSEGRSVEVLFWRSSHVVTQTISNLYKQVSVGLSCPFSEEAIGILITELVQNALKSNFKRCFFRKEEIDFDDPDTYSAGLKAFKKEISRSTEKLADMAVKENLHVRVQITPCRENCINIKVINNCPLLPIEAQRISQKVHAAAHYSNIIDFMEEHQDETEGAGLGMLVVSLSLRELGLELDSFEVSEEQSSRTVASLSLRW